MNLKEAREHLNKGQGGLTYTQLPGCKFGGVMSKLGKGLDAKTLTARVIVAANEGHYKQGVVIISTTPGQVTGRLQDYGWNSFASKRNSASGNVVSFWSLSSKIQGWRGSQEQGSCARSGGSTTLGPPLVFSRAI